MNRKYCRCCFATEDEIRMVAVYVPWSTDPRYMCKLCEDDFFAKYPQDPLSHPNRRLIGEETK